MINVLSHGSNPVWLSGIFEDLARPAGCLSARLVGIFKEYLCLDGSCLLVMFVVTEIGGVCRARRCCFR